MTSLEAVPLEVLFEMRVVARLRGAQEAQPGASPEGDSERINEFIEDEIVAYLDTIQRRVGDAAADDRTAFEPPTYLLDRLAEVCQSIRDLERFRDRLIAFARTYAVDPESSRVIAARTGLSHTTIMRTADDAAVREVAAAAGPVAERMLENVAPHERPDLYGRLSKIVVQARQGRPPGAPLARNYGGP